MADVINVRGGSAGIEAHCDQLIALARRYGRASVATAEQALLLHRYLVHPAVLAGGALDPIGAADFATSLLGALDGPRGLTRHAAELGLLDAGLRSAAFAYLAADDLNARFGPSLRALAQAPPALAASLSPLGRGQLGEAANRFVTADPDLGDLLTDAATSFWSDYALISTVAAWPDGRAVVTATGADDEADRTDGPPRSLSDVLTGLSRRDLTGGADGGNIDVRIVSGAALGGIRRVIVDIPGTKSWSLRPDEVDVTSLATNVKALSGRTTTYQEGVLEALRLAGVTSADEVLLVGHSQGGMVAVNTAAQTDRTGEFRITHVITAGAPIARLAVPRSVEVLAIENDGDVVPHLDGASNADRTNLTTVTVHHDRHDIGENHALTASYLPGAIDIENSGNESVLSYLGELRPFLTGERIETRTFHIERR
ncbi:MAG: hypothetical protein JWM76_199 [Pseudonocardiales bacterium]|nr:hypothetical protein [Pseudonocardiales bacterium]